MHYDPQDIGFDTARIDWKIIILRMISALKYLHDHDILHNDIKSDNIVIDDRSSAYQCVVIDFGKSCFAADGRSYTQRRNDVVIHRSTHKLHPIFGRVIASNLSLAMCIH